MVAMVAAGVFLLVVSLLSLYFCYLRSRKQTSRWFLLWRIPQMVGLALMGIGLILYAVNRLSGDQTGAVLGLWVALTGAFSLMLSLIIWQRTLKILSSEIEPDDW